MKLPIRFYGDPILRKKGSKIEKIDDEIIELVKNMIETMDSTSNGVALAASQVGSLHRIFILRAEVKNESGEFMLGEPEVYINPVLSNPDNELEVMCEGCLSFPGLHFDVARPKSIKVEALNLKGEKISEIATGFKAREIMHENDHLNGVMFIDRVDKKGKSEIEPFLNKLKKEYIENENSKS